MNASRAYDVVIGRGLLRHAGSRIRPLVKGNSVMVVSDSHVAPWYMEALCASLQAAGLQIGGTFVFPAGEESKNGQTYLALVNTLAEKKLTRADCIVALGGGVVGDMAGFAAATYLRGICYVQIPTTLLAMVDSSVGGKTAIDLPAGKNLCGAFYQPALVLCDPDTLKTLPEPIFSDGCAEVIKYGFIGSAELLHKLCHTPIREQLEDVIACCIAMKRDVVENDEFDTGMRQLLNLGHTFAHGIEALSHFAISHGQAVAIGMAIVTRAAVKRGVCGAEVLDMLLRLLEKHQLPADAEYTAQELYEKALSDKKRSADTLTLVVPTSLGRSELIKMPVSEALIWAQEGVHA